MFAELRYRVGALCFSNSVSAAPFSNQKYLQWQQTNSLFPIYYTLVQFPVTENTYTI